MEKRSGVEAVDRALAVLRAFSDQTPAQSLTQLAQATGLYKSTVLRLAESLERAGFVERGEDRLFRPGPELWRIGTLYRRRLDLGPIIRPALRHLVDATGETASFYVRDGDARICLYRLNSPRAIRHHLEEGIKLPLDKGSAGRILQAFGEWRSGADQTIVAAGHYVSLGERDPEAGSVAVPVFDAHGALCGALSVSAVLARFDEAARARALAALQREADHLSRFIGADD